MDRTRPERVGGADDHGGPLKASLIPAVLTAACAPLITDLNRVIAIELVGGQTQQLEEGSTLQLMATAVDGSGNPVSDATITWELLDIDSGQVGFTLDPVTGLVTGTAPGSGRVQARVERLRSGPLTITVSAAADSIAGSGEQRVVFASTAATSPPLTAVVLDLTTDPATPTTLEGKPVEFRLVEPAPGSPASLGFFLTVTDTVPGPDPHGIALVTGSTGEATALVRRVTGVALPDSAVIGASSTTAAGIVVSGSPVEFVVLFEGGGT